MHVVRYHRRGIGNVIGDAGKAVSDALFAGSRLLVTKREAELQAARQRRLTAAATSDETAAWLREMAARTAGGPSEAEVQAYLARAAAIEQENAARAERAARRQRETLYVVGALAAVGVGLLVWRRRR